MSHVVEVVGELPELTVEQAEAWVGVALAEARALRQYDGRLWPSDAEPAALRVANRLYTAWRGWIAGAELLTARVRPLLHAGRHVAGAHDLDHALTRARAALRHWPEPTLPCGDAAARGDAPPTVEERAARFERSAGPRWAVAACGTSDSVADAADAQPSGEWLGDDLLEELDGLADAGSHPRADGYDLDEMDLGPQPRSI